MTPTRPTPAPDSRDLAGLIEAARRHREGGRLEEALALSSSALRMAPEDLGALHETGLTLLASGSAETAVKCLERAAAGDPGEGERLADLGDGYAALDRPDIAAARHRRALALGPGRPDLTRRFGVLLSERTAGSEGLGWLKRALACARPHGEAHLALGKAHQKAGRLVEAVASFRNAATEQPASAEALVRLVQALRLAGAPAEQVAALGRIAAERLPDRADVVVPVIQHHRDRGEEARAWQLAGPLIEGQMAAAERDSIGRHGFRVLMPDDLVTRIGELAFQLDLHVKMKRLGWLPPFVTLLVAPKGRVVNDSFLDYWRPFVTVVDDPETIARIEPLKHKVTFDPVYVRLPDGRTLSKNRAFFAVQAEWQRQGRGPLLDLTRRHAERGREGLRRLGVPEGAWFVSLHVRESGYLGERPGSSEATRNADVRAYLPAIEEITRRGGWVLRLGDPTMTPLPAMAQVVDYAHSELRSDWMDVFLAASCRFMLATTSGLCVVAASFGVPVGAANFYPPGETLHSARDVVIPKLLRKTATGRLLSFEEMLTLPLALTYDATLLGPQGLEAVDSEPEDIRDLALEMLARGAGQPPYDGADEALQERWSALRRPLSTGEVGCRIGRGFLSRHRHLFGAA